MYNKCIEKRWIKIQRTYNLPDELYNRVKKYADNNYIDVTTVIKLALNEYLKKYDCDSTDKEK